MYASVVKIQGGRFTTVDGIEAPIDSAWHLFETLYQSGLYWNFIGFGQLVAGLLLMTQRYAKLGAIINFPIVANVFVITLSYHTYFLSYLCPIIPMLYYTSIQSYFCPTMILSYHTSFLSYFCLIIFMIY